MSGDWLAIGAVAALAAAGTARRGSSNRAPTVSELRASFAQHRGSTNQGSKAESPATLFLRMEPRDVPDDLLVAILLSGTTGNENAADVASRLVREAKGDLARLSYLLPTTRGVAETGRARLAAASELYRRANYRSLVGKSDPISGPEDTVDLLRAMALGDEEQLVAVYLDRRHRVISSRVLSRGSDAFTVVDPKQIYRHALVLGANAVIMAHNHPSGDARPSHQDIEVTRRTAAAGKAIGIPLLDHIVVVRGGEGSHRSLAELGYL